jgi:hypothetical protein
MAQPANPEEAKNLLLVWAYDATFSDFPPGFYPPLYVDATYVPPDRSRAVLLVGIIGISVATVVVIARLAIRVFYRRLKLGLDDILIIPALVCSKSILFVLNTYYLYQIVTIGYVTCDLLAIPLAGLGHHSYDITYSQLMHSQLVRDKLL